MLSGWHLFLDARPVHAENAGTASSSPDWRRSQNAGRFSVGAGSRFSLVRARRAAIPLGKAAGPSTMTNVWPCRLTYHCSPVGRPLGKTLSFVLPKAFDRGLHAVIALPSSATATRMPRAVRDRGSVSKTARSSPRNRCRCSAGHAESGNSPSTSVSALTYADIGFYRPALEKQLQIDAEGRRCHESDSCERARSGARLQERPDLGSVVHLQEGDRRICLPPGQCFHGCLGGAG